MAKLLCRSLGPLIITLIPGKHRYLEHSKRVRQELAKELGEAIDEFGPQIWGDFDKVLVWQGVERCGVVLIALLRIAFLSRLQVFLHRLGYGDERAEWALWIRMATYSLILWYVHVMPQ